MNIADLRPAPYNPRTITPEAFSALETSLGEFGDLSGITWNQRSGHVVAGHQRLDALKRKYGRKLKVSGKDGAHAVVTPAGERFPIRVVDWPEAQEKAANLAANSPFLAGSFDSKGLEAVLTDLNAADGLGTLFGDLRLAELLPGAADLLALATEPGALVAASSGDNGSGAVSVGGGAGAGDFAGGVAAAADVPGAATEWLNFAVPLTAAQHQVVMQAIRIAKARGCEKVSDCLHLIASTYVKEHEDG